MAVTIAVETPLQEDVRKLVEKLNTHLLPLSPPEYQFKMSVEEMAGADMVVFVARDEGAKAVGMGALKIHGDGVGEVKRMFTLPEVRGRNIGRLLLDAVVRKAEQLGLSRLVLETGAGAAFASAQRLYARNGFKECAAMFDYPDSGYSVFFERFLEDGEVRA